LEHKDLIARESDTDKDRMISYDEFLAETKRDEFEKASQIKEDKNKACCDVCLFFFCLFICNGKPFQSAIRSSVVDPDPGFGMEKNPDRGSGMNIPDHFSESLETVLRAKNT
jgi:hypothetical protein